MSAPASDILQYGAMGLLMVVLGGVGWGLKTILARWLDQMDAGIRAQDASATAMTAMANAMNALTVTTEQHAVANGQEHRAILEAVVKKQIAPRPKLAGALK